MESKCKIISLSLLCLWGTNEREVFGDEISEIIKKSSANINEISEIIQGEFKKHINQLEGLRKSENQRNNNGLNSRSKKNQKPGNRQKEIVESGLSQYSKKNSKANAPQSQNSSQLFPNRKPGNRQEESGESESSQYSKKNSEAKAPQSRNSSQLFPNRKPGNRQEESGESESSQSSGNNSETETKHKSSYDSSRSLKNLTIDDLLRKNIRDKKNKVLIGSIGQFMERIGQDKLILIWTKLEKILRDKELLSEEQSILLANENDVSPLDPPPPPPDPPPPPPNPPPPPPNLPKNQLTKGKNQLTKGKEQGQVNAEDEGKTHLDLIKQRGATVLDKSDLLFKRIVENDFIKEKLENLKKDHNIEDFKIQEFALLFRAMIGFPKCSFISQGNTIVIKNGDKELTNDEIIDKYGDELRGNGNTINKVIEKLLNMIQDENLREKFKKVLEEKVGNRKKIEDPKDMAAILAKISEARNTNSGSLDESGDSTGESSF